MTIKKCIMCGKEFEAKTNGQKYCSDECRDAKVPVFDHIGEQHYELTIRAMFKQKRRLYAVCECSCGKMCTVRYDCLLSGNTKACGHLAKDALIKPIDLQGKVNKYGVKALHQIGKTGHSHIWRCLCPCGKEFDVEAYIFPRIQSCGCAQDKARREICGNQLKKSTENATESGTYVFGIMNKKMLKNNTSGVRGVSWDKSRRKWVAQIEFKGKHYYLGRYDRKEDAAEIRKIAEEKMFGGFLEWFSSEFPDRWKKIQEQRENAERRKNINIK